MPVLLTIALLYLYCRLITITADVPQPLSHPLPASVHHDYDAAPSLHGHRALFTQRPIDELHLRHSVILPSAISVDRTDTGADTGDGTQYVTMEASPSTYQTNTATTTVIDNDLASSGDSGGGNGGGSGDGGGVYIVQVKYPFTDYHRQSLSSALSQHGYRLGHYLPHLAYFVLPITDIDTDIDSDSGSGSGGVSVNASGLVEWHNSVANNDSLALLHYRPQYKVDPDLLAAIDDSEVWRLSVTLHSPVADNNPIDEWNNWLMSKGMEHVHLAIVSEDSIGATVTAPSLSPPSLSQLVSYLANDSRVLWIERVSEFDTQNYHANQILQSGNYASPLSLYSRNLTGAGQLVTIGDTGLDWLSCFFYDSAVSVPIDSVNYSHRKIVSYQAYQNKTFDHRNGHGTHTAGSIAGHAVTCDSDSDSGSGGIDRYNGVAKDAKLVIYDFNDGKTRTKIKPPHDIIDGYFVPSAAIGARVSSNSWGARVGKFYIRESQALDSFVYDRYQSFLPIYAAGNFGQQGTMTSVAPSTAKNTLSIGSVRSSLLKHNLRTNQPDLCGSELDDENVSVDRVLSFFSSRGPTKDLRMKPEVVFAGEWIVSARSNGPITNDSDHDSDSGDQCRCQSCLSSLLPLFGTSMSTAIAAGTAALVRQYYTDGFYPTSERNPADGFEPSSALIKATLIAAAINDVYDSLLETPAEYNRRLLGNDYSPRLGSGWGRVELNTALSFADDDSTPDLFVVDQRPLAQSLTYHSYCFAPRDLSLPLRATLAWIDPPASLTASWLLVNDIDLIVHYSDKNDKERVLLGNGWFNHHQQPMFDIVNNVEQVTVSASDLSLTSRVAVSVRGSHLPLAQSGNYSLVVTGHFNPLPLAECKGLANICPSDCSGHGQCATSDGRCECHTGWGGADCSIQAKVLSSCNWARGELDMSDWDYYRLQPPALPNSVSDSDREWHIQLRHPDYDASQAAQRVAQQHDVDLYYQRQSFPSLTQFNQSDRSMSSVSQLRFAVQGEEPMFAGVHAYCCGAVQYQLRVCNVAVATGECAC